MSQWFIALKPKREWWGVISLVNTSDAFLRLERNPQRVHTLRNAKSTCRPTVHFDVQTYLIESCSCCFAFDPQALGGGGVGANPWAYTFHCPLALCCNQVSPAAEQSHSDATNHKLTPLPLSFSLSSRFLLFFLLLLLSSLQALQSTSSLWLPLLSSLFQLPSGTLRHLKSSTRHGPASLFISFPGMRSSVLCYMFVMVFSDRNFLIIGSFMYISFTMHLSIDFVSNQPESLFIRFGCSNTKNSV